MISDILSKFKPGKAGMADIMGRFKTSLILKFSLYAILFLALILIIFMSSVLGGERRTLTSQLTKRGKALAESYAVSCAYAIKAKDDLLLVTYTESTRKADDIIYAGAWDMEGKVIVHSDPKKLGKIYRDPRTMNAIEASRPLIQSFSEENEKYYDVSAPIMVYSEKVGTARIGLASLNINQKMGKAKDGALLTSVVILILGGLGAAYLAYLITKPLHQIQMAIETISKGRKGIELKITEKNEIGQLAKTVERAVSQIQEKYKTYEDRIADNQKRAGFFLEKVGSCFREGVILTDSNHKIIYLNDKGKKMLFSPKAEVAGKHILEAITNVELMDYVKSSLEKPNQIFTEDLKSKGYQVKIMTIADENNEMVGMIILLKA